MFNFAFNSFEEAIYMNGHGIYVWIVLFIVVSCITIFFITYRKKIHTSVCISKNIPLSG